jgi:hypothetical protein
MFSSHLWCSLTLAPNAAAQPRLEAGAQRTLEGVGCRRWFGEVLACRGWSLATGRWSHHNRVCARGSLTPLDK